MILYNSRHRKEKKGQHSLGKKVKCEMSIPMLITKGHERKGGMGKGSVRTVGGCWVQTSCLNLLSFSDGIAYVYHIRYRPPDITFAVSKLLWFLDCHHKIHWQATIWVVCSWVCYLKGTQTTSPELSGLSLVPSLIGYYDSDYTNNPGTEGHHSVAGYCFSLGSGVMFP